MEKLLNKIKDLNIKKAPSDIRVRIYRRILVIKFRPYLYALSAVFIGTFIILGNHIYRNLLETESTAVIKVLAQDFEMSFDYFSNSFLSLNEILPKKDMALLTFNLLAIIGLAEVFRRFKHELLKINN